MQGIEVVAITKDEDSDCEHENKGCRVHLRRSDGKIFSVNIPSRCWSEEHQVYGLNLVFDHSGNGDHYY
jgi:hypothetical protein